MTIAEWIVAIIKIVKVVVATLGLVIKKKC